MGDCMSKEEGKASPTCESGCTGMFLERNRYYTGKYMAARDFQNEQDYVVGRHRLHNRLLHGSGIVCGLEVVHHHDPECRTRWVIVRAGTAIDRCGRELFLCRDMAFELPLPRAHKDKPPAYEQGKSPGNPERREHPEPPEHGEHRDTMHGPFLIGIAYKESLVEYVPALYGENACATDRTQPNRVREDVELVAVPLEKVKETCWQASGGRSETPCRDDCGSSAQGGTCMEPDCPCGNMVPLALVTFDTEHPEHGFHLDDRGRKHLPAASDLLTHIVHFNWTHGEEMTLHELRERKGQLRIRFDRKLLRADEWRTGINPMTFVVQYGGVQKNIEFAPRHDSPMLAENDCEAVFTIDNRVLGDRDDEEDNIAGTWVYVTLKCDFILDCHHMPVDGDFLRGRLPTGDGVPGGVFESWFRVISRREEAERKERA